MLIVQGKVIDSSTREPLELANIVVTDASGKPVPVNGNIISRQSDMKGTFNLPIALEDTFVRVSYVGYAPLTIPAKEAATKKEFALSTGSMLSEVVVSAKKAAKTSPWFWVGVVAIVIVAGVGLYYLIKK